MDARKQWVVAAALVFAMAGVTGLLARDSRTAHPEATSTTTTAVTLTPTPTVPAPPDRPTGSSVAIGDLGRVWFVDRRHGFAVVDRRLVATDDSGQTWRVVGAPISPDELGYVPYELVFTSTSDGYLYGRGIRVTHDGGVSWTDPHVGRYVDVRDGPRDGELLALQPIGESVWALVVSAEGSIDLHVSEDGGLTWRKASTPMLLSSAGPRAELVRVTPTRAYASAPVGLEPESVSAYHHLALTEDGGASWRYLQDPCRLTVSEQLAAVGENELWLVCGGEPATIMQGKEVWRSHDGGVHWELVAATGVGGFEQESIGQITSSGHVGGGHLVAVSPGRAYLGLGRDTQWQTTDGGRTWRPSFFAPGGPDAGARPANFVDATHGWAFGEHSLYRTTDGLHWQPLGGKP